MMYSASLAARKDLPVPLGPERMMRRCSINRLRYRWMIGFGMSVSNTRLSILFSFTPRKRREDTRKKGNVLSLCLEFQPGFCICYNSWNRNLFPCCHTFEVDLDDVVVAHQVAAGQQLRHFGGVRANHLAHPVADDAVWAETQAGQRVHPKHILLQGGEGWEDKLRRQTALLIMLKYRPWFLLFNISSKWQLHTMVYI